MSQALLFDLGESCFALPLSAVREVVRSAWPRPLPRAPYGCLGAIDVRGTLHPLVDLGVMLGLRKRARGELATRLVNSQVVLSQSIGWVVDRTLGVGEISAGGAAETPKLGRLRELVAGRAELDGHHALLLSPEALVGPARQRLMQHAVEGAR
jgi:purine-binding chemotaxis protein CheW